MPQRGPARWLVATLVAAGLWSLVGANPAHADAAVPTNHESRVLSVTPPTDAVAVRIRGGDAFVDLTVRPGHEVVVPDYGAGADGGTYLRFSPDGTVEVNDRSVAAAVNETRFGDDRGDADPDGPPQWRTVATDGTYAWHDHRIHLMVPDRLAVVDDTGRIDLGGTDGTWEVLLVVDGVETVVTGELLRRPAPSPWPWYGLGALAAAGLVVVVGALGAGPRWTIAAALTAVGLLAVVVAAVELGRAPASAAASRVPLALTVVGLAAASAAVVSVLVGARRAGGATAARVGVAGATAALGWWAIGRVDVFAHWFVPSELSTLDRATTALVLGVALAAGVLLVWRPGRIGAATTPRSVDARPADPAS